MKKHTVVYRVTFLQEDTVYQLYTRQLTDDTMVGFVEVEELIFSSGPTPAPKESAESELRSEFAGVRRIYIPQHLVIRIDEVEESFVIGVQAVGQSNVSHFPTKTKRPSEDEKES